MYQGFDEEVTILILVDGFLQYGEHDWLEYNKRVTILILVDGFLQYNTIKLIATDSQSQSLF